MTLESFVGAFAPVDGNPIGEIARRLAYVIVGSAVDAAEGAAPHVGRRHPRALRIARLVGGTLLVVIGAYQALGAAGVLVYVVITGGSDDRVWALVLFLPLALGVGMSVWGFGLIRRGWASRSAVDAAMTGDDHLPGGRPGGRRSPESDHVAGATARWLRTVFALLLWIAGSVIAILAGVPDGYAMLLGCLLPITAYIVYRRGRAAGRY